MEIEILFKLIVKAPVVGNTADTTILPTTGTLTINLNSISIYHVCYAVPPLYPVGDSRVQSRANGMSRERSGEEGVNCPIKVFTKNLL